MAHLSTPQYLQHRPPSISVGNSRPHASFVDSASGETFHAQRVRDSVDLTAYRTSSGPRNSPQPSPSGYDASCEPTPNLMSNPYKNDWDTPQTTPRLERKQSTGSLVSYMMDDAYSRAPSVYASDAYASDAGSSASPRDDDANSQASSPRSKFEFKLTKPGSQQSSTLQLPEAQQQRQSAPPAVEIEPTPQALALPEALTDQDDIHDCVPGSAGLASAVPIFVGKLGQTTPGETASTSLLFRYPRTFPSPDAVMLMQAHENGEDAMDVDKGDQHRRSSLRNIDSMISDCRTKADGSSGPLEHLDDELWRPSSEDLESYKVMFARIKKSADGYIHGKHARHVFKPFQITDRVLLYKIWRLCDTTRDAKLDFGEFIPAVHVARCVVKRGMKLPKTLPTSLEPLNFRDHLAIEGSGAQEGLEVQEKLTMNEEFLECVVQHMLQNTSAANSASAIHELTAAFRAHHQEHLCDAWSFTLQHLRELLQEHEEFDQIIALKADTCEMERDHMVDLDKDTQRYDAQTERVKAAIRAKAEELQALEQEARRLETKITTVKAQMASTEASFAMQKANINSLRADFNNLSKIKESQRFLVQQRETQLRAR